MPSPVLSRMVAVVAPVETQRPAPPLVLVDVRLGRLLLYVATIAALALVAVASASASSTF